MHDLGDLLVEAGFADPVMDQELIRLTWSSPQALLAELRSMGHHLGRHRFAHAALDGPAAAAWSGGPMRRGESA